jgi:hypothetical protein
MDTIAKVACPSAPNNSISHHAKGKEWYWNYNRW